MTDNCYLIKDIRHINSTDSRNDGRYPQRIGSTIRFVFPPSVGSCMLLEYVTDNSGVKKEGYLRTSVVTNVIESKKVVIVDTLNSRYIFAN